MSCRDLQTKSSCMCCWLRLNKVSLVLSLGEAIFLVSCVVIYIITFTQDRRRDSPATCAAARGTTQTRCCVASCRRVSSCLSAAPDTTYAFPAATIVGSWSVTRRRCQWQTRHQRRPSRTTWVVWRSAPDARSYGKLKGFTLSGLALVWLCFAVRGGALVLVFLPLHLCPWGLCIDVMGKHCTLRQHGTAMRNHCVSVPGGFALMGKHM